MIAQPIHQIINSSTVKQNNHHFPLRSIIVTLIVFITAAPHQLYGQQRFNDIIRKTDDHLLADGKQFPTWEQKQKYTRTYHVNQSHPLADNKNSGSEDQPFLTIGRAAEVLLPGERVIIHEGLYRETVHPAHSGSGPGEMISYQAAAGEKVIISGSIVLDEDWEPGRGWRYGKHKPYAASAPESTVHVWQYELPGELMEGYNPFGMMNILHDRAYLDYTQVKMDAHFKRRGMLFFDGIPVKQVGKPVELADAEEGAFWIEHNGRRIHVRFPGTKGPKDVLVEAAIREQLFVPEEYGLGYIRISGITFRHCANGFPVPQRGAVSANRGNHWIIEDCIVEHVNSLGIDLGNEMWNTEWQEGIGHHIVRRNVIRQCGIAGLEALKAPGLLIEDNLFEDIGWHDAEHGWESGGIKLHLAENCLIRRNVFRRIHHAPGIWLDYHANRNCRVTKNVFTDIITARGCIYVEVSRNHCRIDHNVFHKTESQYWISGDYGAGGSALYTDGSDSIDFDHNLTLDIENTGYGSYLNAERIVDMRGGYTRFHRVTHNIFTGCRKHCIEFPNEHNFSDYNIFSGMKPGYLKMGNPAPPLLLDMEAWQIAFGWEKNGRLADIRATLDTETLEFTMQVEDAASLGNADAGPFKKIKNYEGVILDPREL